MMNKMSWRCDPESGSGPDQRLSSNLAMPIVRESDGATCFGEAEYQWTFGFITAYYSWRQPDPVSWSDVGQMRQWLSFHSLPPPDEAERLQLWLESHGLEREDAAEQTQKWLDYTGSPRADTEERMQEWLKVPPHSNHCSRCKLGWRQGPPAPPPAFTGSDPLHPARLAVMRHMGIPIRHSAIAIGFQIGAIIRPPPPLPRLGLM